MSTPALPMTPLFLCRILFYSKNGDVCKKLELKMLRSDREMRVLSSKNEKSKFSKKLSIFPSTNEKHHKSSILTIFPKFSTTWSVITPLFYIWVNIDTRGHTKAPKSLNIAVGPQDPPPDFYQDPICRVTKG